jgi:hypothetical protein
MDTISEPSKLKAEMTYNAAADHFDDGPLAFWDRYGRRTVEKLSLLPGSSVLDVGCGSGASAIPAAIRVGPHGRVIGVDLASMLPPRLIAGGRTPGSPRAGQTTRLRVSRIGYPRASCLGPKPCTGCLWLCGAGCKARTRTDEGAILRQPFPAGGIR